MLNSEGQGHGRRRGRAGQQDADFKILSNSQAEIEGRRPGHSDADANMLFNSPIENLNIAKCD